MNAALAKVEPPFIIQQNTTIGKGLIEMEFKKVSLNDYEQYSHYYKQCMIACADTSFLAIWSMSFTYGVVQAFAKDFFWHKMNWENQEMWLPPVGDWDSVDWESVLTELVPAGTVFGFVPEYLLKKWQSFSERIEVKEMRAEWDYVYSIDRQVEGAGKAYRSWRGTINKFEKSYTYTFNEIKTDDIAEIKVFQARWMQDNEGHIKMTEELIHENQTIQHILDHWTKLPNVIGGILRVDGKVVAYIIVEKIDDNIVSGHVLKADKNYPSAAQFIKYQLFKNVLSDYSVLNAWGDADLEGLRQNKMQENPIVLYKKYEIVWKG